MEAFPVLRMHPNHPYRHHCRPATIKGQPQLRAPLRCATTSEAEQVVRRQSPYRANEKVTRYVARGNGKKTMQQLSCLGYPTVSQRIWMVCQVLSILFDTFFKRPRTVLFCGIKRVSLPH